MRKLTLLFIIIGCLVACTPSPEVKKMAVTSGSEQAKKLYKEAGDALNDGYLGRYRTLSYTALKQDSGFFMANYMLAISFLWYNNEKNFLKYATKAANCKAKLSREELMLKEAIGNYLKDRNADNSEIGEKLVSMFPDDIAAYFHLIWFKMIGKDNQGLIDALEKTVNVFNDCAPVYNLLGYNYMNLNQDDKAMAAFDRYIELRPNTPNPYDSKGDFFLKVRDYPNAYTSFMKAHEIDSLWGYRKAMRVKAIMDSLNVVR